MKYIICIICFFSLITNSCKDIEDKDDKKLVSFNKEYYKYVNVGSNLEMAYLDIGEDNGKIVLLIHGEPNYSYVYRNIAPKLIDNGYRVIIPDLIGFGYSNKPSNEELVTYKNHTKWLTVFIEKIELSNIRLFAHDWGAMISLRIIASEPNLFKKVAISYGYLFEGTEKIPESFEGFVNYAKNDSTFLAGNIMNWGSNTELSDSIKAKYDQPFITKSDYISARIFPSLVPTNELDKEAILNKELNKKLELFDKPFITIWGNHNDLMWIGKDSLLQEKVIGAKNQKHYTLNSNHFIQEDQPEKLTEILLNFFNDN